jgi:U3 small nucleolar ribonucleoprotein protein LCP5
MSTITEDEKTNLIKYLKQIRSKAKELTIKLKTVSTKVSDEKWETSKGLSFLEVKNHLLLSYCTHVMYYILIKLDGSVSKRHQIFKKLVRIRTTIEKLFPLENKLKYQIDKLLKSTMDQDALQFKPNMEDMLSDNDEDDETTDNMNQEKSNINSNNEVYKAPKVTATPYEIEKKDEAKEKREAKKLKILQRSKILQEERAELSSKPMEVRESLPELEALREEDNERNAYEEKSFSRLMYTKKDKQRRNAVRRQARSSTSFAKLETFDGIEAALADDHDSDVGDGDINMSQKQPRSLANYEEKSRGAKRKRSDGKKMMKKKKGKY